MLAIHAGMTNDTFLSSVGVRRLMNQFAEEWVSKVAGTIVG
jgi:hypothetical protein